VPAFHGKVNRLVERRKVEKEEGRRAASRSWAARTIRLTDDSGEFDRAYWASLSGEDRVAYGWELTVAQFALKGIDEDQLGVQRSVACVKRRRR